MKSENEKKICVYVSDGEDWHHVGGDGNKCTAPLQPPTAHGDTIELSCDSSTQGCRMMLTKDEFNARYEGLGWEFPPQWKKS